MSDGHNVSNFSRLGLRHQLVNSEILLSDIETTRKNRSNSIASPKPNVHARIPSLDISESEPSDGDGDEEGEGPDDAALGGGATPSTPGASSTLVETEDGSLGSASKLKSLDLNSNSETSRSLPHDSNSTLANASEDDSREGAVTFEELVDRLFAQTISKSDSKFSTIFLCLYRKFATPTDLLSAIIRRFEEAQTTDAPALVRLASQLRYLTILQEWIADHPGDFSLQSTRRVMIGFVQGLATNQVFAVSHKEISQHLELVCEDDDTDWAYTSKGRSRASTNDSFLTKSSEHTAVSTATADSSTEGVVEHTSTDKDLAAKAARLSSTSTTSSGERSMSQPSIPGSIQSLETAQRQAQQLNPIPRIALDKIRWHQLMDLPDEIVARELTRIDWILYSSIRPRDLVRHVSLSASQKESCKSLEHVNRMISQFNHVAFWVAHWILLRDKPKHRARALEKFMGIAWKLRYLNNYNSLGAVLAGINGTAVHRLKQTRDLISPEMQKQFMRLEILMGTQRSHFAYRLAWENTTTPRIPFLPLHRRDLVHAEEANRTFVSRMEGDLINWKKFEVMGQVIFEVKKSQQLPYSPFKRNEEVQRLLLDGAFSKEDDVSFLNFPLHLL